MPETYRRWRLPALWQMISADTPANTHLHLTTLRRQQTALETQRDRLRTLRDQLAEGWPPGRSEAATVFVQQINDMIDAITLTARGAGELRANLVHIVDAIDRARAELEPLVADYERAAAAADPRVGRHAQRLLDDRARHILVDADSTVAQALALLDVPLPDYARFSWSRQEEASSTPPATTSTSTSTRSLISTASLARTALPPPQFDPPPPVVTQDGFGLAGLQQPIDGFSGTPSGGYPSAGVEQYMRGSAAGGIPHGISGGGLVLRGPAGHAGDANAGRVLPSPSAGHPVIGGPASGRFLPAAGTAGGRPASSARSGGAPASTSRTHGYRDPSFEAYTARRRDPQNDQDDTWSVPEGVAPLIAAPASWDHEHDPGPGVLGIDR
jgi:hypothetical protein